MSFTLQNQIDQARGLRMALAVTQDDPTQTDFVAEEVRMDERGSEVATWEMARMLAAGLAEVWIDLTDRETTIEKIQDGLLVHAEDVYF